MKQTPKFKLLESIGQLYEKSKKCQLKEEFFIEKGTELSTLSDYFGTSKSQTLFIAIVFALNYKGDSVDLNDLIEHFDCNPMKILEFNKDFGDLHTKGIFNKKKSRHRVRVAGANDQYTVNESVCEAILNNAAMPEIQDEIADIFELLEEVYQLGQKRDDKEIGTWQLYTQTKQLLEKHNEFVLLQKIKHFELSIDDKLLYLYLIWKTVTGKEAYDVSRALEGFMDRATKRVNYMQDLLVGKNELLQHQLIELVPSDFLNDTRIKLTSVSNDLLKESGIAIFNKEKRKENIIFPKDIIARKLVFSPSEMKQLYVLKEVLQPIQFQQTQKRLQEKSLPKGIAALLHGAPGTGKTEVVKQIAKETNRELMKVDISQSKSMWFGESEKVVKKIFTDYKSLMEGSEETPILFLNEADAIISKRGAIGKSNTRQTENTIQNIILEELENFEGILIATTNLADNLDSAFERRFLFKILFNLPSNSIRAKIWKTKLPSLSIEDCEFLAGKFNFSGGQIDNIIRKSEINEIVHGEAVSLENLLVFCSEETLVSQRASIGFSKL
ncbi:ATP-binding protein, AAA family [Psychroflexus torquis ATCC 700755]|uniref:ATP-binding protein, AAA family n=1 Tax=Psychroflexus torquis (strain ATCC 700755 / CIP 106069 / ACAM 623) TaxID=313595 RepID=K4IFQ1_PSYTT|nr:AAA family ATPase [Psychroflexus torquis]AFU67906.1 ATP-binding protein, AAA family [Psychroflexus torquis ATCC 700755]